MPKDNNPKIIKVHIYDNITRNKIATIRGDQFTSLQVQHTIDDFSSCQIGFSLSDAIQGAPFGPSDHVYVEDKEGRIIFGGVLFGFEISPTVGTMKCYGHRWVLSRLLVDEEKIIEPDDDILDTVDELLTLAKSKRDIPIFFNREGSELNDSDNTALRFNPGDDIAGALRKIIESIYARWAVRYEKVDNEIIGGLIVRSVRGVTPEGVGIGRFLGKTEDGDVITIKYEEGAVDNNIQDFTFNVDTSQYTSYTKIATRIGGETHIFDVPPVPGTFAFALNSAYGRAEGFMSDYKANSATAAQSIGRINQTYPRTDVDITLSPKFDRFLQAGDRVSVKIKTDLVEGLEAGQSARIDAITYNMEDGYFNRQILANFLSPQKRIGTSGILQSLSQSENRLDGLDKDYLST